MVESNTIIGIAIIVLNLIPFLIKKPKYFALTSIISLIIILAFMFIK